MSTRIVAAVCTCLLAAGCGGSGAVVVGSGQKPQPPAIDSVATVVSGSGSAPAPVISHTPAQMGVEVWLVRNGKLWPAMRGVRATRAVIGAAVKQLLAGPNAADARAGVTSAVPASTQLLGISLHGGVATVDVTSDFETGGTGASERLRLAQLVYTVTQFPTVHGVTLRLDGTTVSALSDGLVLADPLTRIGDGLPGPGAADHGGVTGTRGERAGAVHGAGRRGRLRGGPHLQAPGRLGPRARAAGRRRHPAARAARAPSRSRSTSWAYPGSRPARS